jgi:phosphatidylglycerophosphate synthase
MRKLRKMLRLQWWHIPNLVTLLRLLGALGLPIIAVFVVFFTIPEGQLSVLFQNTPLLPALWALVCYVGFVTANTFAVTAITDLLDGFLAKKIFGTSDLGAVLDPFVDKILMLSSILVTLFVTGILGLWLVFATLVLLALFLCFREWDVYRLKKAEAVARADERVASARQSGRVSMVVFCVAMTVTLMPIVGPWSSIVKSALLLMVMVFSGRSWLDYRREYGKYLK